MICVSGVIADPSGNPVAGALIELRALTSTAEVLAGAVLTYKCDGQGRYQFELGVSAYDAYAQNDRCGDMDYLGTAMVTANTTDGDLNHLLADGGINLTPPLLDEALAAAEAARKSATEAAASETAASGSAAGAADSLSEVKRLEAIVVADCASVQKNADQVAKNTDAVQKNTDQVHHDAVNVAANRSAVQKNTDTVLAAQEDVSAKAKQVADNTTTVAGDTEQVAKDRDDVTKLTATATGAADTASDKAALAAKSEAAASDAATRAENAANAAMGAILDGGECDLSGGKYPPPISVGGKVHSSMWYVSVGGTVSDITYQAGDTLRYTLNDGGHYFKIEAQDDVYSVNGQKGAVIITPENIKAEKEGYADQAIEQHRKDPHAHSQYDPVGSASKAISEHEAKPGAHAISGVSGLQAALDNCYSPENKPTPAGIGAEVKGAATSAVAAHEKKGSAHPIAGVAGLQAELDGKLGIKNGAIDKDLFVDKATPLIGIKSSGRTAYLFDNGTDIGIYTSSIPNRGNSSLVSREISTGDITLGSSAATSKIESAGNISISNRFIISSADDFIRSRSPNGSSNYILGTVEGENNWFVGKGSRDRNDIMISSYINKNNVSLMSDGIHFAANGITYYMGLNNFRSISDNKCSIGIAANRWSVIYAHTGTINTSDAREKTPISLLTTNEQRAAADMAEEIGTYKWLHAVDEKGDSARRHVGMTVQRAIEIMERNGLSPFDYAFICYDKWDDEWREEDDPSGDCIRIARRPSVRVEQRETQSVEVIDGVATLVVKMVNHETPIYRELPVFDEQGNPVLGDDGEQIVHLEQAMEDVEVRYRRELVRPAGDRFSFRTDQLALFIARGLHAKLSAIATHA